ncbi:hypothetical protein, partial [Nodularia sp. UHCC 0506]|uniref:hypothetical protein n=1 Tax=Nodularia sp. UHCC 0506 TaxID=3110243 RepID=UPI002B20CB4F
PAEYFLLWEIWGKIEKPLGISGRTWGDFGYCWELVGQLGTISFLYQFSLAKGLILAKTRDDFCLKLLKTR